jgi:NADH dehydrogenase
MIVLTGATGVVGSALLARLLAQGEQVRVLVRDPRRLGPDRVRVQITLGDLSNPVALRQLVRGAREVVHLAATIRDQPAGSIEELNGLATARLLRLAEAAGAERFVFFGAMGATTSSRTRFFRAKALAEQAVMQSPLNATVMSPSIVYAPGDRWITLLRRMSLLPVMPVAGSGQASYQPIWAEDVAACTHRVLRDGAPAGARRLELAGPDVLTYEQIVRLALSVWGRERRLVHVPLWMVRRSLRLLERMFGPGVFATWEEAELMEVPMVTPSGPADVRRLGVEPQRMSDVLAVARGHVAQPLPAASLA